MPKSWYVYPLATITWIVAIVIPVVRNLPSHVAMSSVIAGLIYSGVILFGLRFPLGVLPISFLAIISWWPEGQGERGETLSTLGEAVPYCWTAFAMVLWLRAYNARKVRSGEVTHGPDQTD